MNQVSVFLPLTYTDFMRLPRAPEFWKDFQIDMVKRIDARLARLKLVLRLLTDAQSLTAEEIIKAARFITEEPGLIRDVKCRIEQTDESTRDSPAVGTMKDLC